MKETLFRRSLRMTKGRGYRLEQAARLQLQKVTGSRDDRGNEKREHGSIQKETKCIGPSLRAIKPGLGNTVQALAQDDKRGRVSSDANSNVATAKSHSLSASG